MNASSFEPPVVPEGQPWPAAALLGLGLPPARMPRKPGPREAAHFKISLAEWSLHKALFAKKINNLDFPRIAREQYGIEGAEFVNQFFKDKAHDSAYLKDLKTRANDHGVTCVLIMIDGEGDMSAPEKQTATRPWRTTRSGSTPPRPWAATRSGSTPASTTARPTSAPWPRPARRSPSTAPSTRSASSARTTAAPRATPMR